MNFKESITRKDERANQGQCIVRKKIVRGLLAVVMAICLIAAEFPMAAHTVSAASNPVLYVDESVTLTAGKPTPVYSKYRNLSILSYQWKALQSGIVSIENDTGKSCTLRAEGTGTVGIRCYAYISYEWYGAQYGIWDWWPATEEAALCFSQAYDVYGAPYSIDFDPAGGTCTTAKKEVSEGDTYGTLPTPQREGYEFAGWYLDGKEITSSTKVEESTFHTLTAKWNRINTVTFDANGGGSVGTAGKEVTTTHTYGDLPEPEREGYGFVGWYTYAEGGDLVASDTVCTVSADHTLYAQWGKNYTVSFDACGGTAAQEEKTVSDRLAYGSLPDAERDGYTLGGWYTEPDGGELIKETTVASLNGSRTLYAHWNPNYTITFDACGGTSAVKSKTVAKNMAVGSLPEPERDGDTFLGWYYAKEGGAKITEDTIYLYDEDRTAYARYSCAVSFNANGGEAEDTGRTVELGTSYGELPVPIRDGYDFTGWYGEEGLVTANTKATVSQTLYAHWKQAAVDGRCGEKAKWRLDPEEGVLVITGSGAMADYDASENAAPWVQYKDSIKQCLIQDGITAVGDYAFYFMSGLQDVVLPDSVTAIGDSAFSKTGLTAVAIPEGVAVIEDSAFAYCEELSNLTLYNGLKEIGDYAFYHDTGITSLVIPDSVVTIGEEAFSYTNLGSNASSVDFALGSGVKTIESAFRCIHGDTNTSDSYGILEYVSLPGSCTDFSAAFDNGQARWVTYLTIENGSIATLGNGLGEGIVSMILPKSVSKLDNYAFSQGKLNSNIFCYSKPYYNSQYNTQLKNVESGCDTLGDCTVSLGETQFAYSGEAPKLTVSVKDGSTELSLGKDYTFSGADTDAGCGVHAAAVRGKYGGSDDCEYYGFVTRNYQINPISLGDYSLSIPAESYTYTGSAIEPELTFCDAAGAAADLECGRDYVVFYENNTDVGTAAITVQGIGNYSGTQNLSFAIAPQPVSACKAELFAETCCYTGGKCTPSVILTDTYGIVPEENYNVTYANNVEVGTASVTVTGTGNYTGQKTYEFTIEQADISDDSLAVSLGTESYAYSGKACEPQVTVAAASGSAKLKEGTDYDVSYLDNVNVGQASAVITGKGNYTGAVVKYFGIEKRQLTETEFSIALAQDSYEYSGNACRPDVTVTWASDGTALEPDVDYMVYYRDNISGGTAGAFAEGKGSYTGTVSATFLIEGQPDEGVEETFGNYTYRVLEDGTAAITGYTGTDTELSVPASVNGKTVTVIGDYAFGFSDLTKIQLPAGIKKIGEGAFASCESLTDVTMSAGVTELGKNAFWYCTALVSVSLPDSVKTLGDSTFSQCIRLASITLPKGISEIPEGIFSGCRELAAIEIPDGVTKIANEAFLDCGKLADVRIPDSLTDIGSSAFYGCGSLKEIYLPASLKTIDYSAFYDMGLETVCYGGTEEQWTNIDIGNLNGVLETAEIRYNVSNPGGSGEEGSGGTGEVSEDSFTYELLSDSTISITGYTGTAGNITIPSSIDGQRVTEIAENAFAANKNLTNVEIPDGVTKIGSGAFAYCTNLTAVKLPDGITKIQETTFYSCGKLTTVNIPDSVTSIDDHAFYDCAALEEITAPDALGSIGENAFYGCSKLVIYGTEGSYAQTYAEANNISFKKVGTETGGTDGDTEGTGGNTEEGGGTEPPASTVPGTENLKPTDKPNTINTPLLKDNKNKASYKVIEQGKTVEFYKADNKKAGKYVVPNTVKIDGTTYHVTAISDNAFNGCKKLKSVTIGKYVTTIGNKAFFKCTSLKKITIPASVTKIGKKAFYGCRELKSINIKTKKLKSNSVGTQAFKGINKKAVIKVPKKQKEAYKKWLGKKGITSKMKIK